MEATNLRMLIEMAVAARDGAGAQLAQARAQVSQAQAQLNALHHYAREYTERARKQALGGMDAATRANWGAFDGKLEAAIAQQAHEIERRQTRLQAAQTEFVEMQKRLKSLETLAARQQEATRQKGMRREQKQTDEIAARSNPALTSPALTTNTLSRSSEAPASTLHW